MIDSKPECPLCKFPVQPPGKAVTGMACPRCNTWLLIDPECGGSCLSCHKDDSRDRRDCVEANEDWAPVFVD